MKKILAVAAAALMVAGFTINTASAKHRHHRMNHTMTTGSSMQPAMRGNNAELMGNNGNSAGGSNSSANTNNPTGMGNNAGPPMR